MILSVLMPVMRSRRGCWELFRKLDYQAATLDVEILVDDSERESGAKRQSLTEKSQGDFICHVDDDDDVSDDYIACILATLKATEFKIDLLTFDIVKHERGNTQRDSLGVTMPANHFCIWKRSIATQIAWCPLLGHGDDVLWYSPLAISGLVKTRLHVPRVLYHYHYVANAEGNHDDKRKQFAREYFQDGLRVFWRKQHDGLHVEEHPQNGMGLPGFAFVRNKRNEIAEVPLAELSEIGKIALA